MIQALSTSNEWHIKKITDWGLWQAGLEQDFPFHVRPPSSSIYVVQGLAKKGSLEVNMVTLTWS
jgi:hypothetical protein